MAATPKDLKKKAEENSKAFQDAQKGKKQSEISPDKKTAADIEFLFNTITDEIRKGDSEGRQILFDLLIKKEHPVLTFRDEHGRTIIHIVAKYHRHKTLLYLVEQLWVSPTLSSKDGHTPLEYNDHNPEPTHGLSTPMNQFRITQYLKDVSTPKGRIKLQFDRIANLMRESEEESYHYLVKLKQDDALRRVQKKPNPAQKIIGFGPELSDLLLHRDELGRHLIHIAAKYLRFKTIQYMVEHLDVAPDLMSSHPEGDSHTPWELAHRAKNKQTDSESAASWALINSYLVKAQKEKQDKKQKEEKAKQGKQNAEQPENAKAFVHQYPKHLQDGPPKQNQDQNRDGTWLFKLSHEKEKIEFDLLGTCHVVPFSKTPLCVQDKVNKTTRLLTETGNEGWWTCLNDNIKKFDGYDPQQSFYKFDAETQKIVKDALEGIGGGKFLALIPKLKPWVILSIMLCIKGAELQVTQSSGMDMAIDKIVTKNNGSIHGLETYADRIKASRVNTLSLLECQAKIKEFSEDLRRSKMLQHSSLQEILKAYSEGDIQKLAEIEAKNNSHELQLRNKLWIIALPIYLQVYRDRPNPFVKKPATLVAVGAAHLVGETGLLSAFSALGYKIERYHLSGKLLPFQAESTMPKKPAKK